MSFTRLFAGNQREGSSALRPLLPKRFNFFIGFLELGNGCAPIGENCCRLRRCAPLAWNSKYITYSERNRICNNGTVVRCSRNPEASQIIIHEIVAVPAAVVFGKLE